MSEPEIVIKRVFADDSALLAHMHAESFGCDRWDADQIRGSVELPTTLGWMAIVGTAPSGFILCQALDEEAEVLTFCVRPCFQGNGIGKKLLVHALENLVDPNVVNLEVAEDNRVARQLYESCGFIVSGTRPRYYKREDGVVDAINYNYVFEN